jgi:tetratricopeptide (TPR) repeat protein
MLLSARSGYTQGADLDRAREYFQAGAQAYAVGEYATAIQAFEQAYQLVPRPAVLFSIAQAERKQYFLDHDATHLTRAIDLYRQYLQQDPHAARKGDAVQALSELEPLVARSPAQSAPASTAPVVTNVSTPTRMMITSSTPEAHIVLDGNDEVGSPLIREVEPGEHLVRITAPGFVESERKIVAVKGALVTVDVALAELPAKLVVIARNGALLSIDGRVQGECPFPKPIELAAGSHLITLSASGYVGLSTERTLVRGETTVVRAPMPRTLQRTSALVMLGAGASAVTAGVVFAILAHQQDSAARGFLDARGHQQLGSDDLTQYNSAHRDRDKLQTAALASFGVGVGFALGGAALLALDPGAIRYNPGGEKRADSVPVHKPKLFAAPALSPGYVGLGLQASF